MADTITVTTGIDDVVSVVEDQDNVPVTITDEVFNISEVTDVTSITEIDEVFSIIDGDEIFSVTDSDDLIQPQYEQGIYQQINNYDITQGLFSGFGM